MTREPIYRCLPCKKNFGSEEARFQHWKDSRLHHFDLNLQKHPGLCCPPCGIVFADYDQLRSHKYPCKHTARKIPCPWMDAKDFFFKNSDVAQHLEDGSCTNIDFSALIFELFPSRIKSAIVSSHSISSRSFECLFCSKVFKSIQSLGQHASSPAHIKPSESDVMFRCPVYDCKKPFTSASGFYQHFGSARCQVSHIKEVGTILDGLIAKDAHWWDSDPRDED
ncbi:hypothetical protein IE53DRAFT_263852 [Violaceomyces palustris]|uniref:Uncharacterized protein n=2 Tax=Violaceomyces palustris TaxID=1673888 RepID=A0ACD0NW66_9BASI|nr:hypothetical protein IE53DRAFT_114316 [Violaceomyces palustris]PWN52644.1 hypothetical protein IE53DRAFT_263852 [Violaceomyces palustris]